jgi:hypothetical protein
MILMIWVLSALLGVFTKQPRVEPLGENTKRGGKKCTWLASVFDATRGVGRSPT